jgi:long-chain acyl-CoA synthetase
MDKTLPSLLKRIVSEYPELPAQYSKDSSGEFTPISYRDYYALVLDFASGLLALGHARGDHIGLIADNRKEWLHASMGIMAIGAADVPRGTDATTRELAYILSFPECRTAVLNGDSVAHKILECRGSLPLLTNLIFLDFPAPERIAELLAAGFTVIGYDELIARGRALREAKPGVVEAELEKGDSDDIATIIFTSGTTGEPKGVMLSHGNFLCQLEDLSRRIAVHPGDRALCVLPVWHAFERLCEYVILNNAASIVYSKPIGSILLADLAKMNPQILPSVPRIWESVYDGIYRLMRKTGGLTWTLFNFFVSVAILDARMGRRALARGPVFSYARRFANALCVVPWLLLWPLKGLGSVLVFRKIRSKLGTKFVEGVSGGGALPPNIDEFFWAVGITVVEGYGLTETAPVIAVRPYSRPIFGTIGRPISCCAVKILDDTGAECPVGVKGSIFVRGGNVMKGYYRKPELTAKVYSPDGWLDTGDLGLMTLSGELILRGRKKDTIVLRGGENIEPAPIEMKINESRFISQSVVLGQDQRYLGALIVVNKDELLAWAKANSIEGLSFAELLEDESVRKLYEAEIDELVSPKNGFKLFERINHIVLLEKPFETGVELSAKQEIMRYKLSELYKKEIHRLFD